MFAHRSHLNRHLRVHSGGRPFSCNISEKSFTERCNLVAHLRLHSGERPFSCKVCKKRFTRLFILNMHLRSLNEEKILSCRMEENIYSLRKTERSSQNKPRKITRKKASSQCDRAVQYIYISDTFLQLMQIYLH
jgi:uncharacterized Zn-finger protein